MQYSCKQFLKNYWSQDIVFEEFPIAGTRLSIDFYNSNKKIAVRSIPALKYVPHFHGKSKSTFLSQISSDNEKQDFCKINGIKIS